jgi:exodeoxyribonuclease V alpha subunit
VLAGLVERVTFHNAETGFCVLRVKARGQRELPTVVGHTSLSPGEWVPTNALRLTAAVQPTQASSIRSALRAPLPRTGCRAGSTRLELR